MALKRKALKADPMFALALQGGEEILKKRTVTTMGVRFPADSVTGREGRYEHKLYDGAAGIGIVLLDLYTATRDSRYAELVEEISYGLVASTPEHGPLPPALYSGFSGVALFHLACARILKKCAFLEHAIELGNRLSQSVHVDTDLFRGAAGTGLVQLALFHATRDQSFLDGARRAAAFLAETAVDSGDKFAWPVRDPRQPLDAKDESYSTLAAHIHTGLAHGAAGIGLFLLELSNVIKDPIVTHLLEGTFRWLESKSLRLRSGVVWPRSEAHRVIQNHWCHGSAGIGLAYLARYRFTRDAQALEVAEAAGQATWDSLQGNFDEPFCHCHGIAGAIEMFLDLADESAAKIWHKRARSIANRFKNPPPIPADATEPGEDGPSLGLGTAGVVRQLLRLSGFSVFPILNLNRDVISLKPESGERKTQRKEVPSESSLNELLPPAGIRFGTARHFLIVGQPDTAAAHAIVNMISNSAAGDAYFRAVDEVTKACERLQAHYGHLIERGVLNREVLSRMLREIAGMVLRQEADAATVRRAVKRMTANSIAALELMFERLSTDVRGVLAKEIGGRLKRIYVRGSDPHRGGQRVVAIQFEEGPPLLYKARSIAIDRELAGSSTQNELPTLAERCREWLQPAVQGAQLPTHRLIVAGEWHGYAEEISATDISTFSPPNELTQFDDPVNIPLAEVARLKEEDERRYWYSAGLLAGHAFSLGMVDLHSENVVCGNSLSTPLLSMHAVDLELAFANVIDLEDTHLIEGPRWGVEIRPHSHAPFSLPSISCGLYAEDWVIEMTSNGPQPVTRPWLATRWIFPHLIQNADGSFGYTNNVCALLRGFADQWMLFQSRIQEISDHLREKLCGVPMRVLFKPTRSYVAALIERKLGGAPIMGAAVNPALSTARPFLSAEIRQLNHLDVPYFFRFLGEEDEEHSSIYWIEGQNGKYIRVRNLPSIQHVNPFWSVVERQGDPNRLARAVVDIAWVVVPQGPFDFHDPTLGVRVVRTTEDERVLIIVVLGEKRLTCRVASDGKIEWWLD